MSRFAFLALLLPLANAACSTDVVSFQPSGTGDDPGAPVVGPNDDPAQFICYQSDDDASFAYAIDATAWPGEGPNEPDFAPETRDFEAACTVDQVMSTTNGYELAFACEEDRSLTVTLGELPDDFALGLVPGDTVSVDYHWNSPGHHLSEGEWLLVHRDGALALGIVDDDGVGAIGDRIEPFGLEAVAECSAACEDPSWCDEPQRMAVSLTDVNDATFSDFILDEGRGNIAGYQLVVEDAKRWICLNCSDRYRLLIAAEP